MVEDLDLSGVHYADSEMQIEKWQQEKLTQNITLVCNKKEIPVSLQDLGASIDKAKILSDINNKPGQTIRVTVDLNSTKATQFLAKKLAQFVEPAKDAAYKIENDKFIITDSTAGKIPAFDKIIEEIDGQTLNNLAKPINVTFSAKPANLSTETLETLAFDGVIGEFSTNFVVHEKNRSFNLNIAAKALDQKIIRPGDVFSFNDTVGPRTSERGYKEARIIINNQYVLGTGGGVCQVSSTLYNALLLADLPVEERTPHQVPVVYVPLGQDATVYYPNVDLKFKNNTESLIYIRTSVQAGILDVKIYGKKTVKTVQIEHQTEKVIKGQGGRKGYIVKTWKIVKDSQAHENRTLLSRDVYAPVQNDN